MKSFNMNGYLKNFLILIIITFVVAVGFRFASLSFSPLFDTTETRYASIAQKIIIDNDWITLRLPALNEPFLGKPPLSFWLVAISYKLFGSSELAARLPNFVTSLLVLLFTFLIARKFYDKRTALFAPLISLSCIFFFVEAGTVSLDMMVCFTMTLSVWAYLSILQSHEKKQKWWQLFYELALGLSFGLGMLNKGPLSIVLSLGVIFLYTVLKKQIKFSFIPNWFVVFVTASLVALPWYLAVQKANPDFNHYFFVQENFERYLRRDYGDRYGNAHHEPYGMSWLFLLGAFMPWSFFLFPFGYLLWKNTTTNPQSKFSDSLKFLICWAITAPLFFTMARSILMTYILPSVPALSILCGRLLSKSVHYFQSGKKEEFKNIILAFLFGRFNSLIYIAISVVVILAGAIAYSSSAPYSMPRLMTMINTIMLGFVAIGIGYLAANKTSNIFKVLILISGLGIPMIMSFWYGPLSKSIGEVKSMKAVIQLLAEKLPDYKSRQIEFIGDIAPFSWYFYNQVEDVNNKVYAKAEKVQNKVICDSSERNLFVITEPHLKEFSEEYPYQFARGFFVKAGKYYIFKQGDL
jgi:4-amino-4-deoxy-L-arabinose transferase-like glycosyltransferase